VLILAGSVAFWFALAAIGLYFTPLATMGVIVALYLWGRTPNSVRATYRIEFIFPLIAPVWVLLSILCAETFLPPPT
jgi:formate-dependent nitrite reductase membrane component NrfD